MSKKIEFCKYLQLVLAEFETSQYALLGADQISGQVITPILATGFHAIERKLGGFDYRYTKMGHFRPDNQGIFKTYFFDLQAREQIVLEEAAQKDDLLHADAQKSFMKLISDLSYYAINSKLVADEPSVPALAIALVPVLAAAKKLEAAPSPRSPRK